MSGGRICARGVEGSTGRGLVFRIGVIGAGGGGRWMLRGKGCKARFWLRVIEVGEVVENSDKLDIRLAFGLGVGVEGSGSGLMVKMSLGESVDEGNERRVGEVGRDGVGVVVPEDLGDRKFSECSSSWLIAAGRLVIAAW